MGLSRKKITKKHWKELTHPDDLQESIDSVKTVTDQPNKINHSLEKRYITGYGTTIYCRITSTALKNEKGEILYWVHQLTDITQRKQALSHIKKGLEFIQRIKEKNGD